MLHIGNDSRIATYFMTLGRGAKDCRIIKLESTNVLSSFISI